MGKIIKLTESELINLVKKVIKEQSQEDTILQGKDVMSDVASLAKNIFLLIWNAKPGMFALAGLGLEIVKDPMNVVQTIKNFANEYKEQIGSYYDEIMINLNKIGPDSSEFANEMIKLVKSKISVNQLNALTAFAYNVGMGNFQKSTLLKLVNVNPNDAMIAKEFLKWNKAAGKELKGLTNRRIAESALYFTK